MGHIAQALLTQFISVIDLTSSDIGHRHLGSRRKIKTLVPLEAERILGKFRQLPGPRQRGLIDDIGDIHLLISVRLCMGIQHKLRECAVQSREVT